MKLNDTELQNKDQWENAGIILPKFNRMTMIERTKTMPEWVHFGAGNIFRAFPAVLQQTLLEKGLMQTGIVVVEDYDGEIIDKIFLPHDCLTLSVTLKSNDSIEKRIIGSVAQALRLDRIEDFAALRKIFAAESLKIASFTITEKGYNFIGQDGYLLPDVAEDIAHTFSSVDMPKSYIGKLVVVLFERYKKNLPIALVSMDNCSHNGEKLFSAVSTFAEKWTYADKNFLDYINNPEKVSFPLSMIDKITPRPDETVRQMLEDIGFFDTTISTTSKQTYIAPFVNAEETQYLVIEDVFPNGRPPFEKIENCGVFLTDRETVDRMEKMKVCTCLNPLHTALAVFGCLLGYTKISEEMKDPDLVKLVEIIGYKEGLPVVVDPFIVSPKVFIDQVIKERLPNPFMPDTPQRIICDTSQKIPIRFGETIKAYMANATLNIQNLCLIPLTLAAWVRYLLAIDDNGTAFQVSPDPFFEYLSARLKSITLGEKGNFHAILEPILSDKKIFAVNLYEAGLGEKVEALFTELVSSAGAVRKTLHRVVN
ncbi:MAG: mannitol dehydrogenase family protein [Treponema sp.]|jgi:fructuronate reductase|nr:mannitol dehydrogenase family protein [Treponema sp.]